MLKYASVDPLNNLYLHSRELEHDFETQWTLPNGKLDSPQPSHKTLITHNNRFLDVKDL